MELITIFADLLYSVKFNKKGDHEFVKIFNQWQDPEMLFDFFETNKRDLNSGFFGKITVEEAVMITIDDANYLEDLLLFCSKNGGKSALDIFFKNDLYDNPKITELVPKKGYGKRKRSWLRLYAIELSKECYVVTGGAIKLTRTLQERAHTKKELMKIEKCIDFLKENGIYNNKGVIETIEIQ
ncbi:MAG TPA: hypothetical protein DEO54_07825 [Rikenellaceae bacterium]|nr:MAG: hypothetical protein A2X20_02250 [Bacteroidetes bacterium GWE2_40_15]HBZ26133.1 hypothetical protein [Rikenellaceae bacterium]